jgi:hypothetical protein
VRGRPGFPNLSIVPGLQAPVNGVSAKGFGGRGCIGYAEEDLEKVRLKEGNRLGVTGVEGATGTE